MMGEAATGCSPRLDSVVVDDLDLDEDERDDGDLGVDDDVLDDDDRDDVGWLEEEDDDEW